MLKGSQDMAELEARLERARRRLERAHQTQAQVARQFERREVLYAALLFANDELERAQRQYDTLGRELEAITPEAVELVEAGAPRPAPPPRETKPTRRRRASAKPTPYRERKEPECSDCVNYEFHLDPSGYYCRLSGRAIRGDGEICQDFVAANPCPVCGHPIGQKKTRPPKYCSDRCRKLAWWRRHHGKATKA